MSPAIVIPEGIRGLIFDCDGTLADTMPAHYRAWSSTLARHGIAITEDRFYQLGGTPTVRIVAMLAAEQGVTVDAKIVAAEKEVAFLEFLPLIRPVPSILDIADRHRNKMPMAVASGGYRKVVSLTLAQIGVADWFEIVVTAEDTTHHKPEPDVFLEAANRLKVGPSDCMVFEDTDIGLEAARRAGMTAFDVRRVYVPRRVSSKTGKLLLD